MREVGHHDSTVMLKRGNQEKNKYFFPYEIEHPHPIPSVAGKAFSDSKKSVNGISASAAAVFCRLADPREVVEFFLCF
jgi:hypothetical protein